MSTAGRKSSVGGARRGPQKAHIPYRGDNPEVGKKTGIAVRHVERKSDGFEPFEEIMSQADKRTPPKPKGRRKKSTIPVLDDDLDENGEMSMELDDSPMQYFANSRHPATPSNISRAGSSSRHMPRTSDVDFDEIPSPRPRGSARKSIGRSSLSKSVRTHDLDSDSDPPNNDYGGMDNGGYDDASPQGGGSADRRTTHHETSFTLMDQDDDDDDDDGVQQNGHVDEEEQSPPPVRRDKGKERALSEVPEEPEEEYEEDIAQALDDVDRGASDDDEMAEEHPEPEPRRTKKAKFAVEEVKKAAGRQRGKSKKENRPYREGVRKSAREHYKPLEYWRGEKLVYGRSHAAGNGLVLVPPIREIVRIPKEQPEPLGKRKRTTTRGRSKSKAADEDAEVKIVQVPKENPEEGWDDDTDTQCVVLDFPAAEEVARRIALTARMVHPVPAANNDWAFMKVFGDADFIAAGILVIPPKGRKPSKSTKDNTYVFYVIEGAVNLKVHNTSLVLATGAMFLVPRGNTYFIENIAEREAKIFFTQARKMAPTEEELKAVTGAGAVNRDPSKRPSADARKSAQVRSSSAGAATQVDGAATRPMSKAPTNKRAASTRV